ncbi:hypothetical protein [Palleronia caenipelagi]|uniref:hypothetical protein n=1 Tax=Palleronia caenipelagi TaxID=2489174 RepID=UPI00163DD5A0|nr:hypothetical protein [Palleronia caenipelagi]
MIPATLTAKEPMKPLRWRLAEYQNTMLADMFDPGNNHHVRHRKGCAALSRYFRHLFPGRHDNAVEGHQIDSVCLGVTKQAEMTIITTGSQRSTDIPDALQMAEP